MRRLALLAAPILLALVWSIPLRAQEIAIVEHQLENGLRLFLHENPRAATVDCRIVYRVGSADEWAGATGISHFLEHLMFKGTTTINAVDFEQEAKLLKKEDEIRAALQHMEDQARFTLESGRELSDATKREIALLRAAALQVQGELDTLINSAEFDNLWTESGASGLNASTSFHRTSYTVTLPANKLELFFWVESDRLRNPVFREFYKERGVVTDERLTRTDASVSSRVVETALNTLFEASGYNIPTVGWPSDLARYTRPQAIKYFRTHYRTDNTAICLSGNFEAEQAIALAEAYFGEIAAPEQPKPRRIKGDMKPLGQRVLRATIESPMLFYSWQLPGTGDPGAASMDMLANMMNGETGPMHKRFVATNEALAAGAFYLATEDVGFFILYVALNLGANPEDYRQRVRDLIDEIKLGGLDPASLVRARRAMLRTNLESLETDAGVADLLAEGFAEGGWERRAMRLQQAAELSVHDIAFAASANLKDERAMIGLFTSSISPGVDTQIETRILGLPKLDEGDLAAELPALLERESRYFSARIFAAREFYDQLLLRAGFELPEPPADTEQPEQPENAERPTDESSARPEETDSADSDAPAPAKEDS